MPNPSTRTDLVHNVSGSDDDARQFASPDDLRMVELAPSPPRITAQIAAHPSEPETWISVLQLVASCPGTNSDKVHLAV